MNLFVGTLILVPTVAQGAIEQSVRETNTNASADLPLAVDRLLVAVRINGINQDEIVRMASFGGRFTLSCDDWDVLHLRVPALPERQFDGQSYRELDSLPDLRWHIEKLTQTLIIDAPPSAFIGTRRSMDSGMVSAATWTQSTGLFANYDLELQRDISNSDHQERQMATALIETGASGIGGAFRTTGLVLDDGFLSKAVRLDSTWTQDRPDRLASLRLGDAVSRSGAWGNAMRFGGLQWATDFKIQPGVLTVPLPAMHGEAALPSTIDLYINNSHRLQGEIPAGPFDLTNVPIVTGSGEVRLVVKDILGREQVIVQPYYISPELLKSGLHSYSYEIGFLREDYGLSSDHYGALIAMATDRLGVTETFTREFRVEAQARQIAAGVTGMGVLPPLGMASVGAVVSYSAAGGGGSVMASVERQSANWNGSLQIRYNTAGFTQSGDAGRIPVRMQAAVAIGTSIASAPLGFSYVQQAPWFGPSQQLMSANVSHALGRFGTLSLFAQRDIDTGAISAALALSVALDTRTSVAVSGSLSSTDGARGLDQLHLQRGMAEKEGVGYQVDTDIGSTDRVAAQAFARVAWADLNAGIARRGEQLQMRTGISGALAWMDDSVFAARRIDGSFAVVEVGDYPGLTVLHDNHPVARTDEHGRAFIGGLRGYEINHIGVDPAGLPFDARVDSLDMEVVPPARSGVLLRMPLQRSRAASFRIVGANGAALPAGTVLRIGERDTKFPVGFEGRTFISGLGIRTLVHAYGAMVDCEVVLNLPAGDVNDLPDLGTLQCV